MRFWALLLIGFASFAPAAFSQTSPSQTPNRKAGWWEMKMNIKESTGQVRPMVIHICTDPKVDRIQSPFGIHNGKQCPPAQISKTASGWSIHSACTARSMKVVTDGTATGDLKSHYSVDLVTRMTPPPQPDLGEVKIHIDAKWLGACPAGKKPGQLELQTNVAPAKK